MKPPLNPLQRRGLSVMANGYSPPSRLKYGISIGGAGGGFLYQLILIRHFHQTRGAIDT
jgi:hypothetical protein